MKRKNSKPVAGLGTRNHSASLAASLLLLASCSYSSDATVVTPPLSVAPDVAQYHAPLAGADGDFTVTLANTILNSYTTLSMAANKGDKDLTVTDASVLTSPDGMPLKKGDLILVYQTQGATMDTTDDAVKYGKVTALNGAGKFEFVNVVAVTGNKITIAEPCKGVQNNYQYPAGTQVIRVPQFDNLTINPGASVVAKTWDSATRTGGLVALHVLHETKLGGTIDVTARGFSGGKVDNVAKPAVMTKITNAVSKDEAIGASKGESIAGTQADYIAGAGNIGRGAPANGGGGGNAFKTGGGGGAGGGDAALWNGNGLMDGTVTGGMMAWALDQAYKDNGNKFTTSTGGGRGGYAYSRPALSADPTVDAPGDAKWGIYSRFDVGGLGGHPLSPIAGFELFVGGGGGAGDQADGSAGIGGSGGGVVILMSNTVTVPMGGVGLIKATGGGGQDTGNGYNDGAGGGGGGGSIFVLTGKALDNSVTLAADGGAAGSQRFLPSDPQEAEGPGGGGGGGVIVYMAGGSPKTSVKGQAGGVTLATTMTKFPSNGATSGFDGLVVGAPRQPVVMGMPGAYPICLPADLQVTVTPPAGMVQPGSNANYDVTVKNLGENPALGADVTTTYPPGVDPSKVSWTCMPMGVGVVCPQAMGTGPLPPQVDLPAGGSLNYKVSVPVPAMSPPPSLDLSVSAYPPPGYTDPDMTNNKGIGKAVVAGPMMPPTGSDLKVVITVDKPNPMPGDVVTYTGQASNGGPDKVNKPVVVITVPPGAVITQPGQGDGWTCTQNGQTATCTRDTIPVGDAPPITVKVKIPDTGLGSPPVTKAEIDAPMNTDPNPGNNTSTVDTRPTGPATQADLALSITKNPTNGTTGMEVAYTLQATNKGPATVKYPSVTFSVPEGSTITQPPQGQGWDCLRSGYTFTCYLNGDLAVGDAAPITVKVNSPAAKDPGTSPGAVSGVVSAPANNDPNLLNNVASVPVENGRPVGGSDLEIKITSKPSSPGPGDVVTYEGKASNKGPDPVKDPNVTINLPPGAEVVEEPHGDGWKCVRDASTVLCTRESIPLGEAPPIIVKVRLPKDGSVEPTAVATVSAPNNNDPVLSNNIARSEVFRLVGGGYGCSLGGHSAPDASGLVFIGAGLAIAVGLRRRRSLLAA